MPSPVWVDKVGAPPDTLSITGMNGQRYLVSRDGPRWKRQGVLGRLRMKTNTQLPFTIFTLEVQRDLWVHLKRND